MADTTISDALNRIEFQLGTVTGSVAELRGLIEQAGLIATTTSTAGRLKLHEAMAVALRQRANAWTKISDLTEMINTQELYVKGDQSRVEPNQLHARANRPTYQRMFEKNGPMIRLRLDWTG
jgi:hypothetical protein